MNETMVTVTGNVATDVVRRDDVAGGPVARFRLAATVRRWDRQRLLWVDGHTSFYTVWARGVLAENLAASVTLGEPLLVRGRLRVRDEEHGGQRRMSADIDATAVGHDLARGTSAFRRVSAARPELTGRAANPGRAPISRRAEQAERLPASEGVPESELSSGVGELAPTAMS